MMRQVMLDIEVGETLTALAIAEKILAERKLSSSQSILAVIRLQIEGQASDPPRNPFPYTETGA